MATSASRWDTDYEWKAVTLLALGFGLVGLDRWIIAPLFPFMAKDLGLDYQAIGNLVGILGMVWGIFAVVSGRLSDRIGHRRILVPAVLLFSFMSGMSGLANTLGALVLIRGLMGLLEGSYCPTSFAATAVAAHPSRRGFLQGLQQSGFALFGFGLGPIIATQLLAVVPSWRWVFWVVAIPGFLVGVGLWFVLREPGDAAAASHLEASARPSSSAGYGRVFRSRNIVLCMLALACAMSCIFVLGGMLPNYLIDYLHLSPQQMGFVASALGFGGFVGQFAVPGVSDLLGRRVTAVLTFLAAALGVWGLMHVGPSPSALFMMVFVVSMFSLGAVALITGPIATESAPAGLVSSAIGVVVGSGEIFGGGVAPAIGGAIAQRYGIENIFWMPLVGVVIGVLVSIGLNETAPRKVARRVMPLEVPVVPSR
jgi:predicted MFS family arabinose efflux permease